MLNAKRLGVAGGIVWGASVFLMTLASLFFGGYGGEWLRMLSDVYPGFVVSYVGSIVGLVYGFVDGFIGFYLIGWLYNKLNI